MLDTSKPTITGVFSKRICYEFSNKHCTIKKTLSLNLFFFILYLQFKGQLGLGKSVKFLSKPTELSSSLLPGKVMSVSVGENTCAAVTGMLKIDGRQHLIVSLDVI